MLNKFQNDCFVCGKSVPPKQGDFQHIGSLPLDIRCQIKERYPFKQWLVRCFACKGQGNLPHWLKRT